MSTPVTPPTLPPADLSIGAFSDSPPWIVDPDHMPWRRGVDQLRARARSRVPYLVRRRYVPPGPRVARVCTRIGSAIALWYLMDRRHGREPSREGLSMRLRLAFQELGPTYIKLGQIISSGEGLFPDELVAEFKMLRDRVPAESFRIVREVMEEELGRPLASVFSHVDREPLAAASIAQVHRAVLVDGTEVVVKVQRPLVASLVQRDLAAMSWLAPLLTGRIPVAALANPTALVTLFAETIVEELDFRLEAQNMLDIASVLAQAGQKALVVPRPHPDLVTRRVLVMERLSGFPWDDTEAMHAAGVDTAEVLHASLIAFLEGAMLYGVFHGDLHGGNLFVMRDGRVALLDYGITGRLDEQKRRAYLRLLMGAMANDAVTQVEALKEFGALPASAPTSQVISDLGLDRPMKDPSTMSPDELLDELRGVAKALLSYGAKLPKELMLMVKNLLFLDGAVATMAPDVDILAQIADIAQYFAIHHGERIAAEAGIDPRSVEIDEGTLREAMGLQSIEGPVNYEAIRAQRRTIQKRMRSARRES